MTDNPPLMTLAEIRDRLDLGDSQMLEWLATRANLVREVARIKGQKGDSVQAAARKSRSNAGCTASISITSRRSFR